MAITIDAENSTIADTGGTLTLAATNLAVSGGSTLPSTALSGTIPAAALASATIPGAQITGTDAASALASAVIPGAQITGTVPSGSLTSSNIPASQITAGILSEVNLKDYGEVTNALGSAGGSRDINLTLGNSVSATVSASTTTWTFSNPTASDEHCSFVLFLTNGGSQTVNWPASVDWAGGTAPTLTTSGLDVLCFSTIDGGTIWHGFASSLDSKTPS